MKGGCHTKQKTAEHGDPDDPDDPSGEESDHEVDNSRPDRHTRPDKVEDAEESERSVREITPLRKAWEQVTGQKQRPNANKSKQLATGRGLAKIRNTETCDNKSQKWRDQITGAQWGSRVVKCLLWQEYDMQGGEGMKRGSFLGTDSAGIWYDMYERETEPEDRNIHSCLCLFREKLILQVSKHELWNQYNGCHNAQLDEAGTPAPLNQYAQKLEEYQVRCLDEDGERVISNHIKKMKFVCSLIPALKEKVRLPVDWGMHFDEIVSIAEKIDRKSVV